MSGSGSGSVVVVDSSGSASRTTVAPGVSKPPAATTPKTSSAVHSPSSPAKPSTLLPPVHQSPASQPDMSRLAASNAPVVSSASSSASPSVPVNPVAAVAAVSTKSPVAASRAVASALPRLAANRLYVPSLGINTSIVAAPVRSGVLVVPAATKVGKWTGSASYAASSGRIVIAGHTMSYGRYKGALAPIARAKAGTVIYVSDGSRHVYRFVVTSKSEMKKANLPASVFYGGGRLTLQLVTCGGRIQKNGHHTDNVVVAAVRR